MDYRVTVRRGGKETVTYYGTIHAAVAAARDAKREEPEAMVFIHRAVWTVLEPEHVADALKTLKDYGK